MKNENNSMPKPARNRHRQTQALHRQPELESGQSVCRVIQACGENIYEVELEDGEKQLYTLPKRLRYVTYIKRGSFVFVRDDDTRSGSKVRGDIEVVVLDHFLATLKKKDFWPSSFIIPNVPSFSDPIPMSAASSSIVVNENNLYTKENEEGHEEEYRGSDEDWQVGTGNPNRSKWRDLGCEVESEDDDDDADGDAVAR